MRVVISFDPDSVNLLQSGRSGAAWVVESFANRCAAEHLWREPGRSARFSVTLFEPQRLEEILPTALEHHPSCDALVVQGADFTRGTRDLLREYGFASVEPTDRGFQAMR
jgi:hypothetical protein